MKPGDKLICLFVNDYTTGDSFKEWPLHITIVPWFRTKNLEGLIKDLAKSLSTMRPIKLTVAEERFFGRNKKLVNLIKFNKKIENLEATTRDIVKSYDSWIVDESTKLKRSFRPHITVQKNERMVAGDRLNITRVYVVKQSGEFKEVVLAVDLNGKS